MSIGVGFLAVSHPHCAGRMSAVRALAGMSIAGVYDPDEEVAGRVASDYGVPTFASDAELLESADVDLVVIEGTNIQSARLAIRAAEARRPFLVEKPGANNLKSLQQVCDAVRISGVVAQVGYHLRYSPAIEKAKQIIDQGLLGRITTGRFHCAVMSPWLTDPWFCDPDDRGGLVFNDFCHMLDLLTVLFGEVTSISGSLKKLDGVPDHPYEDSAAVVVEFGDVLVAGDVCGWEANEWIETWDVQLFGTEGTLLLGIHKPWTRLYLRESQSGHPAGWGEWSDENFDGELNYHREIADFVRSVDGESKSLGCTIEEARRVMHWIDRFYSAEEST